MVHSKQKRGKKSHTAGISEGSFQRGPEIKVALGGPQFYSGFTNAFLSSESNELKCNVPDEFVVLNLLNYS